LTAEATRRTTSTGSKKFSPSMGASVVIAERSAELIGDDASHFLRTAKFRSAERVPR